MRAILVSLVLAMAIAFGAMAWRYSTSDPTQPLAVPSGDQEIAWIQPATGSSAWERFVTGVLRLSYEWPDLQVDDSRAFSDETTAVPEIVLAFKNASGRLRVRWYKLSKGANAGDWIKRLAQRAPAPLVVVGGGTSDRAYDLARAMSEQKDWRGEQPVLFLTTATASTIVDPSAEPVNLMDVYAARTFRMCYTNAQIARAVVEFVWSQPDLRPFGDPVPLLSAVGATSVPNMLSLLGLHCELDVPIVSALEWDDDPYSIDLSKQFHEVLHDPRWGHVLVRETRGIPFSVGGQYDPNRWEAEAVDHLLAGLASAPLERQLLVLPTSAAPARRVLRSITAALPLVGRNLVAVTGDSISLNNIYRDADIGWNMRAIPVPLVSFAHQNPVAWDEPAPEEDQSWAMDPVVRTTVDRNSPAYVAPPTNTDELLQHRDMTRLIIVTAYGLKRNSMPSLTKSSTELANYLRAENPAVFAANGDRISGRGEYVLCLRPHFSDSESAATSRIFSTASLEVWTRQGASREKSGTDKWIRVKRLILNYDRSRDANP